ncbi:MAG TPA: replication factor C large subunit [Candidatus Lokiarchaeia archaeon]|nr:replication factor C large subunit [Candidatus Lokiarchaeia archaeon]
MSPKKAIPVATPVPPARSEIPWFEKYRPNLPSDMVGFEKITSTIRDYIQAVKDRQDPGYRALILEGPPGVGKTTVVYAIAHEMGYNVVETNASEARTVDAVRDRVAESSRSRDIFDFVKNRTQGKILLFDEVDGISGQSERGGLSALIEIIQGIRRNPEGEIVDKDKTPPYPRFPIIMTANEYDSKFASLYKIAKRVPCRRLQGASVIKILKRIATAENVNVNEETLQAIADNSNGDLRSAINDLQAMAQGTGRVTVTDVTEQNMSRDTTESIFTALNAVFKTTTLSAAKDAFENLDLDYSMLHSWVNENLPAFLINPLDLAEGYANVAVADNCLALIGMYQDYGLLAYFYDLISGGISLAARRDSPKNYVKPVFPAMLSSRVSKTDLPALKKIQQHLHISQRDGMRYTVKILRLLAGLSPEIRKAIIAWLELEKAEEKLLK